MSLLMDALRRAEKEKKAAAEKLREKDGSLKETGSGTDGLSLALADDDDNSQPVFDPSIDTSVEDNDDVSQSIDPDATIAEARENLELETDYQIAYGPPDNKDKGKEHEHEHEYEHGSAVDNSDVKPIAATYDLGLQDEASLDTKSLDTESSKDATVEHSSHASLHDEQRDQESHAIDRFTIDMSGEAGDQTLSTDNEATNDTLILENGSHDDNHQELPEYEQTLEYEPTLEQTRTYSETSGKHQFQKNTGESASGGFSPVAAQNVFAAKKYKSQTAITVAILILLITVGLTAAGFFYYFSVTPANRQIMSPRVDEGIAADQNTIESITNTESVDASISEPDPLAPPTIDGVTAGVDTSLLATINDLPTTQPESRPPEGKTKNEELAVSDNESVAMVQGSDKPVRQTDESGSSSATESISDSVSEMESEATGKAFNVTDEELALRPALVKISRSSKQSNVDETVTRAYKAYSSGNLLQARELYEKVLETTSDNRNALLGLGAIAVRQSRFDSAYQYYGKMLQQNPSDHAAIAALVSIQQQADPANSEARIRRLLESNPAAPYLYQALGHVYARTQRWPQAQKAYFDAFSRDSNNADYAFNLAVSLEQLNQSDAALEYYNKALDLATTQPISFERVTAQERINRIRQVDSR